MSLLPSFTRPDALVGLLVNGMLYLGLKVNEVRSLMSIRCVSVLNPGVWSE